METAASECNLNQLDQQLGPKFKILNERATLFKITSSAMINACSEFYELTQTQVGFLLIGRQSTVKN